MSVWARGLQACLSLVHCVQGQGGTRFSYRILETEKLICLPHPTHWTGLWSLLWLSFYFIHPSIHPPTHPSTHLPNHPSIHSSIHPSTYPPMHSFTHAFILPPTQLSICPVIHLLIYPCRWVGTIYLLLLSKNAPVPRVQAFTHGDVITKYHTEVHFAAYACQLYFFH